MTNPVSITEHRGPHFDPHYPTNFTVTAPTRADMPVTPPLFSLDTYSLDVADRFFNPPDVYNWQSEPEYLQELSQRNIITNFTSLALAIATGASMANLVATPTYDLELIDLSAVFGFSSALFLSGIVGLTRNLRLQRHLRSLSSGEITQYEAIDCKHGGF